MAATTRIVEKNGATPVLTDKTSGTIRFKNADNATVDLVNPMVKPATGTDFSFEKWLRFEVTGGTYSQITNLKAYSDGANGLGTGVGLFAKAVALYATPAEATVTTGYVDFFTYTSAAALTLGAGPFTATGEKGDHLVMIATVADTAAGGVTASESVTFAWDEI